MPDNKQYYITAAMIDKFKDSLLEEERSIHTIEKYMRDLKAFCFYLAEDAITKDKVLEWKKHLIGCYAARSVNSMLAAVNHYLAWAGLPECQVKALKIQQSVYCSREKELTKEEYYRLIRTAKKQRNQQFYLLIQTICATGIRVSELPYITVEAVETGYADVDGKGKHRTVFLPEGLCLMLGQYCAEKGKRKGSVFSTRNGKPLDRSNIWRDMKKLCKRAGVEPEKVFPHNLRHLFARMYYSMEKDLSRLADVLGHSSVNTTRIYTVESGNEHRRQINRLGEILLPDQGKQ